MQRAWIGAQTWEGPGARLELDSESFLETPELTSLSFHCMKPLSLMPDCLTGLTALARLSVCRGGLVSIPHALTALSDSLTLLGLRWNDALQLAHQDVTVLMALRKLQTLDLVKSVVDDMEYFPDAANQAGRELAGQLDFTPSLWTRRSEQHFAQLPASFLVEHGHTLALRLDLGDSDNEEFSDDDQFGDEVGAE